MGTGTGPFDSQDILNRVWFPAGTAPTADPDKVAVYLSGVGATANLGAFRQFKLDEVTTGSSSATGTVTTGLAGYRHAIIYLVGNTMTGTASTYDIYIDSRLDGTNWVNIVHMNQVTSATGGTSREGVSLSRGQFATGTIQSFNAFWNASADLGAGTALMAGWADDMRVRRTVSGGTTAPIFSYTIWVNVFS